jgi:hypothetical protein
VNTRCLDNLNVYGIKPIRLIIIIHINSDEVIKLMPLICFINVRMSCDIMIEFIGLINDVLRDEFIQNDIWVAEMSNKFVHNSVFIDGENELNIAGSNDEKMSNIIQNVVCTIYSFEGY